MDIGTFLMLFHLEFRFQFPSLASASRRRQGWNEGPGPAGTRILWL